MSAAMIEDYLTWETRFLVPLVLAVAFLVYRRDDAEEIRCLWIATAIAVACVGLNSLLVSQGRMGLPASLVFFLLVVAYLIRPSIMASFVAAVIGGIAACAAAIARLAAAGLPLGLEEGRGVDILAVVAAVLAGVAMTVLVQFTMRRMAP
jgi:dolichyl-phosphate-mannose--protein O-mannosyl transferase